MKALSFVMHLVRLKRKTVLKLKLIKPLLNTLFPIMCTHTEEEDDEEFDENEAQSPAAVAAQVRKSNAEMAGREGCGGGGE